MALFQRLLDADVIAQDSHTSACRTQQHAGTAFAGHGTEQGHIRRQAVNRPALPRMLQPPDAQRPCIARIHLRHCLECEDLVLRQHETQTGYLQQRRRGAHGVFGERGRIHRRVNLETCCNSVSSLKGLTICTSTPAAVLIFRFDNPDALMTLLLVGGAAALLRAIEDGRWRWLVAAGALVWLGFSTKFLQAWIVLPALR